MRQFNIHAAKTQLSRLVDEAEKGEPFIICKAGKPKVKVVPIDEPQTLLKKRFGFMKGMYTAPADIKGPWAKEIEEMFYGEE